jgi:hypothetical protein
VAGDPPTKSNARAMKAKAAVCVDLVKAPSLDLRTCYA